MPRPRIDPDAETVRINFRLPADEAERLKDHARRTGDEGNVSRMLRRLAREDIRRFEKAQMKRGGAR